MIMTLIVANVYRLGNPGIAPTHLVDEHLIALIWLGRLLP